MATVLVVDDDPGILQVLNLILTDEGHTVVSARNGREALAMIAGHKPDLVLFDLMMPAVTGWEVLAAMRRQGSTTPVVFMSAGTNAHAEAVAYGADGFLAKPFTLDSLLDVVARYTTAGAEAPRGGTQIPMAGSPASVVVAILNSSDDMLRLLQSIVEGTGFASVTAHVDEIGRTEPAIREFLSRHGPRVVLFDVSPPYPPNWALFAAVRDGDIARGTGRRFLVTTPNKRALEDHVGPTAALEIAGDAIDRATIAAAIRSAVTA